jgi:hypothetical protein
MGLAQVEILKKKISCMVVLSSRYLRTLTLQNFFQYWLTAPENSRNSAHTLLSARLSRTDAAARHAIVQEWTARLRASAQDAGSGADEEGGAGAAAAVGMSGFSGPDGAPIVVLAVLGSHFQDLLDHATAERVAQRLQRAVTVCV